MTTDVFTPPAGPTILPGGQAVTPSADSILPSARVAGAQITADAGSNNPGQVIELEDAVVMVRNVADTPFRARYLTNWVTIQPGVEAVLPWDIFVHFFGNPQLRNVGNNREREEAYRRLRFKYGALEDDERWEQTRPRVECRRMNGEPIVPLCDDPEGRDVTPATITVAGTEALQQQIAYLQQQVAALASAQGAVVVPEHQVGPPAAVPAAVAEDSGAIPDEPRNRVSRRRG